MVIVVELLLVMLVGGYIASPFWEYQREQRLAIVSEERRQEIEAEIEREVLAVRTHSENR